MPPKITAFDPERFKQSFPLFAQEENRKLVYLDNAATTQRPAVAIQAMVDFYTHSNANTHRSSHRLARAATAMIERTRSAAAEFLGASQASEVVFCRGATEALNLLAHSLASGLRAGDEILITQAEHHANLVPWQILADRYDLNLRFLPLEVFPGPGLQPDLQAIADHLGPKTALLSITAASNALGFSFDVAALSRLTKDHPCKLIVDGAQLAAHQILNMQEMGCDFFVCSAHKFYGPTGVGLLYGKAALLEQLPPWQGGGEMIRDVTLERSEWAEVPHRFEAGTASLAAIAGLEASLKFLAQQDREAMQAHEQALCLYAHQQLQEVEGLRLLSVPENNLGIVAIVSKGDQSVADLGLALDEQDVAVRAGHHCAQPLSEGLAQGATLRASIAAYNTKSDIDSLCQSLVNALSVQGGASPDAVVDESSELSIDALLAYRDWQGRFRQLLQWGKSISSKPEIRLEDYLVQGCESDTWISWQKIDGKFYFQVDSDSRVVKGLAAFLLVLINAKSAQEILALDIEGAFEQAGLKKHLSPSRSNGFYALLSRALSAAKE